MPNLQQINIGYNRIEDRLLLKVSNTDNEEVRLWMTCHLTGKVLEALNGSILAETPQISDQNIAQQALQADKAIASQQADTSTPYVSEGKTFPLGEAGALITSFSLAPVNSQFTLKFGDNSGKTTTVVLDRKLLLTFISMLEKSVRKGQWILGKTNQAVEVTPPLSMTAH